VTILSPQVLTNVLDLIEAGASVVETTAAIGAAPKSKVIFGWLKASEHAGEFGARPDASSPWCITWGERPLEFFHLLYREAVEDGRVTRTIMRAPTPIRADLEARLAAKRAGRVANVEPSMVEQQAPPRVIVEHVTSAPVVEPPPRPRPSPAARDPRQAPRIEGTHGEYGPPSEGRFSMTRDRIKSQRERLAGTIEFSDAGIKRW
jgi:hypothetical protein